MASEFINVMHRDGVTFVLGDRETVPTGPVAVDFNRVIALDSLISDAPIALAGAVKSIGWIDQTVDIFRADLCSSVADSSLRPLSVAIGLPSLA